MRLLVCLFSVTLFATSCGQNNSEQEHAEVVETPAPAVDSVQLQVLEYEQRLAEGSGEIDNSVQRLQRLSVQLQDSIEGTAVPPQIQEETINNYQNKLHELRAVQQMLQNWQQDTHTAPDSLDMQARKAYLEQKVKQMEQLLLETRQVRREAQAVMEESDRVEY